MNTEPQSPQSWVDKTQANKTASPIKVQEVVQTQLETNKLQEAGIKLLQGMLDNLVGRRAESTKAGKEIVEKVRGLAKQFGVRLCYKGAPIYFKWQGTTFTITSPDSTHAYIDSSVAFLPLTLQVSSRNADDEDKGAQQKPEKKERSI